MCFLTQYFFINILNYKFMFTRLNIYRCIYKCIFYQCYITKKTIAEICFELVENI